MNDLKSVLVNFTQMFESLSLSIQTKVIYNPIYQLNLFFARAEIERMWFCCWPLPFIHKSVLLTLGEYKKLVYYAS